MKTKVTIQEKNLVIEPQGLDKIWALKDKLVIPLVHVKNLKVDGNILKGYKGIRIPGTAIPGYYYAGTFKKEGKKTFYNTHQNATPLVIELKNEDFDRLIIEVDEPESVINEIKPQLS